MPLMSSASEKQQAHELLDQLDGGQLSAVVHLLRVMTDPVARAIASAPVDDDSLTPEDVKTLDESAKKRLPL